MYLRFYQGYYSFGVGCEWVCSFRKDEIKQTVVHIEKKQNFCLQATDTEMFKNRLAVVEIKQLHKLELT